MSRKIAADKAANLLRPLVSTGMPVPTLPKSGRVGQPQSAVSTRVSSRVFTRWLTRLFAAVLPEFTAHLIWTAVWWNYATKPLSRVPRSWLLCCQSVRLSVPRRRSADAWGGHVAQVDSWHDQC